MKLNKVLFGTALAVNTFYVLAADPAPVIDVSRAKSGSSSMTLSQQLSNLERKLDARNRAQVNVQRQLDELQNEVNQLRGVTELHTHQLSQVLDRQRDLYQELDRRVAEALKPASKVPASLVAPAAGSDSSVNYSSDLTENEAYDRAVNLVLKDKRYEQAIPEFRSFNKKFPNSSYAAHSHYWLGLLLFNKNELTKAKIEFDIVVNDFAHSNKRSEAMLKLAMLQQKKNKITQAIAQYRLLIEEYPGSSAAILAKTRLETLTQ